MRIQEHPILGTYEKGQLVSFTLMEKHYRDMPESQSPCTEKCRRDGAPLHQKRA